MSTGRNLVVAGAARSEEHRPTGRGLYVHRAIRRSLRSAAVTDGAGGRFGIERSSRRIRVCACLDDSIWPTMFVGISAASSESSSRHSTHLAVAWSPSMLA